MKNLSFIMYILFPCFIFSNTLNVPSQFPTIQDAINQSISGDTILVDNGTYYESINYGGKNIVLASHFILNNDTSKIYQTIINGYAGRVINFNSNEDSSAQLIGFTIQNGFGGDGGGIRCDSSSPTLNYLIIQNNTANFEGGGIYAEYSDFTIKNSIIKNNRAGSHWGGDGGGMAVIHSSVKIENVHIINNETIDGIGGAAGGGIFNYSSSLFIKNVLICKNKSGNWPGGGGVGSHYSNVNIINSTICENIYQGIHSDHSNINLINSICWNNQFDELRINATGSNKIVICHSNIKDSTIAVAINDTSRLFWFNTNISRYPEFVDTTANNYNLLSTSPCIDAGIQDTFIIYNNNNDTLFIPGIEFYGLAPDMGAFEFDPATILSNGNTIIPSRIKLEQNYPNPFNSSTKIKYYLPKSGNVRIEIYNLLGQKIKMLTNRFHKMGIHEMIWDGLDSKNNRVTTGIYIYKLISEKYSQNKKLLLLK